jgi:hypothetical protein
MSNRKNFHYILLLASVGMLMAYTAKAQDVTGVTSITNNNGAINVSISEQTMDSAMKDIYTYAAGAVMAVPSFSEIDFTVSLPFQGPGGQWLLLPTLEVDFDRSDLTQFKFDDSSPSDLMNISSYAAIKGASIKQFPLVAAYCNDVAHSAGSFCQQVMPTSPQTGPQTGSQNNSGVYIDTPAEAEKDGMGSQ